MSRDLHGLRKESVAVHNRLLLEKGRVKVLEKAFPARKEWEALRSLGEINPGSLPLQQVLAVLSDAVIPGAVLTSCGIENSKDGILVQVDGEVVSHTSYMDALKKGRRLLSNLRSGLEKIWVKVSTRKVALVPGKGDNANKDRAAADDRSYIISLSAAFLLSGNRE
jgi:hypothetical protein